MIPLTTKQVMRKLGGDIKTEKTTILEKKTYTLQDSVLYAENLALNDGSIYDVYWQGKNYTCVCKAITLDGEIFNAAGNLFLMGTDDTGEPFYMASNAQGFSIVDIEAMQSQQTVDRVIGISCTTETIVPIDQKYIHPMGSITLNGADGNQYKLTVDENGELAVNPA